jgi:hypothetical protein
MVASSILRFLAAWPSSISSEPSEWEGSALLATTRLFLLDFFDEAEVEMTFSFFLRWM